MVEQKRFDIGSAWFAKELQRFYQLQKEYLFLVDKEIKSVEDLIWYRMQNEMRKDEIQKRQQELYRINSSKKRRCKTVEDIREYQIWHMDIQSELDKLKQEKKEIKEQLKIVEGCLKENLHIASWYITNMKEYVKDTIELPEYTESQRIENTISHKQEKSAENKTIEKKLTYEDYCILTPEEKIKTAGFMNLKSFEEVNDKVRNLFAEFGHKANVDEIMAEAETLYKEMVEAKADWLYELPQWNNLLSVERRKELYKEQKKSNTIVKEKKVGRNDPCPCGSGKKYKHCHGKM